MAEPPELWVVTLVNLIVFGFGSLLTMLGYLAYRSRRPSPSFRDATLGFGSITIGGVIEPIYQFGIKGDYYMAGRELLAVQGIEGTLIAVGLGLLFYSIKSYDRGSRRTSSTTVMGTDDP